MSYRLSPTVQDLRRIAGRRFLILNDRRRDCYVAKPLQGAGEPILASYYDCQPEEKPEMRHDARKYLLEALVRAGCTAGQAMLDRLLRDGWLLQLGPMPPRKEKP